jgi:hypothetical protein
MLARLFRQASLWSAYWRIYPLWNMLRQAVPEVELPPVVGTHWNIHYRLHRRVIEIRDAQLVLRPYSSAAVTKLVAAIAQESGLSSDRTAAVAEAATIISALRSRGRGLMCRHDSISDDHAGAVIGNDIRAEADRLILVCRAVRHSPIVRQIAGRPLG